MKFVIEYLIYLIFISLKNNYWKFSIADCPRVVFNYKITKISKILFDS